MAKLIYLIITSLDGYIEDLDGKFDWAVPDDEVHGFVNDLARPAGTHLYGRKMYDTMAVWETDPGFASASPIMSDFARIWQAADKIVFSTALQVVPTARTRVERAFVPEAIRELKATASRDILIGGPGLASHAFRSHLVGQCSLFLAPVVVGGGKHAMPHDLRLSFDLERARRFDNGMVYIQYRVNA